MQKTIAFTIAIALAASAQRIETEKSDRHKVIRVETAPNHLTIIELAEPVTEVAADAQRLLQHLGRGRVITGQPPHHPQVVEGVGLAEPVADVPVDAQGLLQDLGRGRVITRHPPDVPQVVERVGLAEPVAEVAVDAQGVLQGLGRGRVITGQPAY